MANHAYASVWVRHSSEAGLLGQYGALLETVPFSTERPGFSGLVIRAVTPSETPLAEHDLRQRPASAVELFELLRGHVNADCAYEAAAHWDLWVYDAEGGRWEQKPQRLEVVCYGEEYDDGQFQDAGHFQIDLGFEHLFTGHAGLLGLEGRRVTTPQHPTEARLLERMALAENLREYQAKTRENIRKLLEWMEQVAKVLPVERSTLWSEGEENFEARLDEIVAMR